MSASLQLDTPLSEVFGSADQYASQLRAAGVGTLRRKVLDRLESEHWITTVGDLLQAISTASYAVRLEKLLGISFEDIECLEEFLERAIPSSGLQLFQRTWTLRMPGLREHDVSTAALALSMAPASNLPRESSHIEDLPEVFDQAQRGTCVACSATGIHEWYERTHTARSPEGRWSVQHLYWECKQRDGSPGAGTALHFAVEALSDAGQCVADDMPYNPKEIPGDEGQDAPSPEVRKRALQWQVEDSFTVPSKGEAGIQALRQVLSEFQTNGHRFAGRPVYFGVPLFESFFGGETARTGKVVLPQEGERVEGHHAMVFVGYRDGGAPGGGYFIVRNSWGTGWASANPDAPGHCYIPYRYVQMYGHPVAYGLLSPEESRQLERTPALATTQGTPSGLHPTIQRWIDEQGWTRLRPVQQEALQPILEGREDVLISAGTAGGKTEAAFLPISSRLAEGWDGSIRCLAISPLKALLDDQHARLKDICRYAKVPVHRWHGDVPQGQKRKVQADPNGILFITPESLEGLLVRLGEQVGDLFSSLSYAVIDELHVFIGSERGRQLQSLLHRIEALLERRVPRVGLSATLGDIDMAAEYLRPGRGSDVLQIAPSAKPFSMDCGLYGLREDPDADAATQRTAARLFRVMSGTSNLVFANSRGKVEMVADLLASRARSVGVDQQFYPHHGSLAERQRKLPLDRIRSGKSTTIVCTTTLELGIDIGDVDSVAQIGCPSSVAALRQRLGRSGRRSGVPRLRLYVSEPVDEDASLTTRLREELTQATAMIELLLENWFEPPDTQQMDLSTLVQQILSVTVERGHLSAGEAYTLLCETGPFRSVDQPTFDALLASLEAHKLLSLRKGGELSLLKAGERIVQNFRFYAAFSAPLQYILRDAKKGRRIGDLPLAGPLLPGTSIIFGGARWQVTRIEADRRIIHVVPVSGGEASPPRFVGGGGFLVHAEVRRRMHSLYDSDQVPSYLDERSRALFAEGRAAFSDAGLSSSGVVISGAKTLLFPWTGDRELITLQLALRSQGLRARTDGVALVVSSVDENAIRGALRTFIERPPQPAALVEGVRNMRGAKYDRFLTDALLAQDYASRLLEPEAAQEVAKTLLEQW